MSRYNPHLKNEPLFKAAEHWRQQALLTDGSVFTDQSLWRTDNFDALKKNFIERLDVGEGNFLEKLEAQLEPAAPEVKQLAAEMLWVMLLSVSNISEERKRVTVETVWSWSEVPFPENFPWLQDECLGGAGSAGTGYNTNRWRELAFFIELMIALKQLPFSEKERILADGWAFAEWIDQGNIGGRNSRQFRHMILFLLFPDNFERIFGGTHRRKIVSSFTEQPIAKLGRMSALEIDRELAAIRAEQEETYGTNKLDFYIPPLNRVWTKADRITWLFTWNPEKWVWKTFDEDRATTHQGKTVRDRWNCANKHIRVGEKAYLRRSGKPPKGIIAVGNVISDPYEAPHWNEEKASEGQSLYYVDIELSRIQDPDSGDPYLTHSELASIKSVSQDWSPQSSGIQINGKAAAVLENLWEKKVGTPPRNKVKNEMVAEPKAVYSGAAEAMNLILYGPPGTGKTYKLNELKSNYTSDHDSLSRESWLAQQLLEARWFDVVFAALYDLDGKRKVGAIANHGFVQSKARAMGRRRNITQTIWSTLLTHARENSQTVQYKSRSAPLVFDKDGNSVWSLVDDWEEECQEQVALAKAWRAGPPRKSTHQRFEFVTFHQAYSYEDFVEGIRPIQDEETGELAYRVVPGVFQRISQCAKADPEHRYAIFIDEINRGNIARIFGELITLVEPDKRATYSKNGELVQGMEVTLPYSGSRFSVPKNLDLFGSMNTADRSIALLDTALRRRFRFKELMPEPGLIKGSDNDGIIEDDEGGGIDLRALLNAMNRRIRFLLNRDMTLGHAYFFEVRDLVSLKGVLLNQIIPLLQEYFYEDWHRIQLVFRDVAPNGDPVDPQIIVHKKMNKEEVLGSDHDDFQDSVEYHVADEKAITSDSIRKVYEEND